MYNLAVLFLISNTLQLQHVFWPVQRFQKVLCNYSSRWKGLMYRVLEARVKSSEHEPIGPLSPLFHNPSLLWKQSVPTHNSKRLSSKIQKLEPKFTVKRVVMFYLKQVKRVNKRGKRINSIKYLSINGIYPVVNHAEPSLSTKNVSNGKLHDIKREIKHNAVKPDDTSPFPPNTLDSCEFPVCVYCN